VHAAQAAGHRVTAFYLQIWFQEDFRNSWDACPWEEDLSYCRQVSGAHPALLLATQRQGMSLQVPSANASA
jgi:hypothetical protein